MNAQPYGAENPGEEMLAILLADSSLLEVDDVPRLVARCGEVLGASLVRLYLADYQQTVLVPLRHRDMPDAEPLHIDTTLAGRPFRTLEVVESEASDGKRLWMPLLDGTERLGVIEVVLPAGTAIDPQLRLRYRHLARLAAELVVSKTQYGDAIQRTQRLAVLSVPAEVQHGLLPPLSFSSRRVVVSGAFEPAYDVAGDAFDYAVNGDVAHVAVFDAMGHGLEASLLATVAVGAYRQSRRRGDDLARTDANIDERLSQQFGTERFVTAALGELNLSQGVLRLCLAGHPAPLHVRGTRVLGSIPAQPGTPLGMGHPRPPVHQQPLEPGDRVLFYSDGVVEARSADGEFFGLERLEHLLARELASGQPAPETVRRLTHAILAHQDAPLQDDATLLLLEWKGQGGVAHGYPSAADVGGRPSA